MHVVHGRRVCEFSVEVRLGTFSGEWCERCTDKPRGGRGLRIFMFMLIGS